MNYKRKATITLTLVALGFAITSILMWRCPNIIVKMLFYILEAALIGGMADWFAVTAIFRKPLGFPFHTAIVPRNRVAIVNSIVGIVEKEFLSAEILGERLNRINITDKIFKWLEGKNGKEYLRKLSIGVLENSLKGDGAQKLSDFINKVINESLKNIDLDKYLNEVFEWSLKSGEYKKLLALVLEDIIKVAEGKEVRDKIFTVIDGMKAEKTQGLLGAFFNSALEETNLVNIGEIADSIHMHLIETLYNLKDEENLETKHILSTIEEHLTLNAKNPLNKAEMDNIKEYLFKNIVSEKTVRDVLIGVNEELLKLGNSSEVAVLELEKNKGFYMVIDELDKVLASFTANTVVKAKIEEFLKQSILTIINREHNLVGKIVRDTLEAFSDDDLNKFIEDRAGNDLQWIRINGSIVGGLVGLLVFLFINCFYDPIGVPFIHSLFR